MVVCVPDKDGPSKLRTLFWMIKRKEKNEKEKGVLFKLLHTLIVQASNEQLVTRSVTQ